MLIASLLIGWLGGFAMAQQPQGTPPTLEVIQQIEREKGVIRCKRVVAVLETRTISEKVVVNGQEQTVTKTVVVPVTKESIIEFNLANSRVITTAGKQLPIDEVWKRLKANTAVAISADSNTPAPAFLRALNADTLVIIPAPPKQAPMPK